MVIGNVWLSEDEAPEFIERPRRPRVSISWPTTLSTALPMFESRSHGGPGNEAMARMLLRQAIEQTHQPAPTKENQWDS
jgi:hypothetical protein